MRIVQIFILISAFSMALISHAEDPIEERGIESDYWGIHIGKSSADVDFDDGQDFEYTSINLRWGRQMSKRYALEAYVGISDKDKDTLESIRLDNNIETNVTQVGVYALRTFRKERFYANARLGIGRTAFVYSVDGERAQSAKNIGLSYGLNAGLRFGDYRIQIDHIIFPTVDGPIFDNNEYDSKVTSIGFNYDYN